MACDGRGGSVGRAVEGCGGNVLVDSVKSVRRRNRATKANILVYVIVLCKREHAEIQDMLIFAQH